MIIQETEGTKIEGAFNQITNGIKLCRYTVTEYTGVLADMNGGQYCGEIRTLIIMPESTRIVVETDAQDYDYEIDFDEDSTEYIFGSDESLEEIYYKYLDL